MVGRFQVRVGLARLIEAEDPVDRGPNLRGADEPIQIREHRAAADENAHQARGSHQDRLNLDLSCPAADAANDGNRAAGAYGGDRTTQSSVAADFDAPSAGDPQHLLLPFGIAAIVDRVIRSEGARAFELFITRGGDVNSNQEGTKISTSSGTTISSASMPSMVAPGTL
jgi:hypothetical protein